MNSPSIHWFRLDLRLADNPSLRAAAEKGGPVVPVFIWAPDEEGDWPPGAASKCWLHQSLQDLCGKLRRAGSRLVIRRGPTLEALRRLAKETGARAVFWNRRYEPTMIARDAKVMQRLRTEGLAVETFNAALLHEPSTIQNQSGKPFQVFTPFWKHCLIRLDPAGPLPAPPNLPLPVDWPKSLALDQLELEPKLNWAEGMRATWHPGADGATQNLKTFLAQAFDRYSDLRNRPNLAGTSRLSPHLHFGEISPRQVWHTLARWASKRGLPVEAWRNSQFVAELGWREFAHHLLYHFPQTPAEPLRAEFSEFPWRKPATWLQAWQSGQTGFPIVDAGMRELWATGWMHNRVRMIVASFLVKDLLISWQNGARWFWNTLVDADLANNTLGWQWTAGCGADAAPYFRVFNPTSQGEKFDPEGDYVRRWCPEIARLPAEWIHRPDKAPAAILGTAGVELRRTYPQPIVSHAIACDVALEAFARAKAHARRNEVMLSSRSQATPPTGTVRTGSGPCVARP